MSSLHPPQSVPPSLHSRPSIQTPSPSSAYAARSLRLRGLSHLIWPDACLLVRLTLTAPARPCDSTYAPTHSSPPPPDHPNPPPHPRDRPHLNVLPGPKRVLPQSPILILSEFSHSPCFISSLSHLLRRPITFSDSFDTCSYQLHLRCSLARRFSLPTRPLISSPRTHLEIHDLMSRPLSYAGSDDGLLGSSLSLQASS